MNWRSAKPSGSWRVWLVVAMLVAFSTAARADDGDVPRNLIPAPRYARLQAETISLVVDGKATISVLLPENADPKEKMAADWVVKEIAALSGVAPDVLTDPSRLKSHAGKQFLLASDNHPTENLKQLVGLLDQEDLALLEDPKRAEQGYVLHCTANQVAIVGGSPQGTLYGAMTLLQLLQGGPGQARLPSVHIRDWPDFHYRAAENWTYTEGRLNWGRGWCYDWGDGVENYRQRVTNLFDRCLRYKINMICFSTGFGDPFSAMWSGDDFPLQKELNRLAADRGIKLLLGGYGVAAGDPELLNRESYPDGKEYRCLTTNNFGNCRSNDELTRKIQARLRDYVRKVEPRALYIHHEDSDTYTSAEWLWKHRCERCQKRWPNEAMAAADGAAGAFAHGYDALCEAIFSVKNADSGYDAARDCLVTLVSPTYTAEFESDAIWDKQLAYWTEVGKLLQHKQNVCIGIREQFLRLDNGKRRILEMAEVLGRDKGGPGMFLYFVSPASIYQFGPLFVPVPAAMGKLNEGAEVAYYMCGNIFQEPQIVMNAAHMWNTESLGSVALPANAAECRALYGRYAHRQADPPGVFGPGGFLEQACRSLYGEKAGKHMETLYAMKRFPICFARELYIWNSRSRLYYDWAPELTTTQEALSHVNAALQEPDCPGANRPILERFQKSLQAGEHFIQIRLGYQQLVPLAFDGSTTAEALDEKAAAIEGQIQAMERFLAETFTFDWATPRGGDIGIWKEHLAGMRHELASNVQLWAGAIRARQAAARAEASGAASLVTNGGMEEATGWTFRRVTGEEQVAYADGGYVTDRALEGRRSYRIVKPSIKKLSDQWPMPQRTTWGQIEQEIAVEPGQKYALTFQVFNNNDSGFPAGRLQHEVLVDDQEMWAFDSSAPKGWKAGGCLFVPKGSKIRLILRTTDLNPIAGWEQGEGDSWWDQIQLYPVKAEP